jgi:hypothetical protein
MIDRIIHSSLAEKSPTTTTDEPPYNSPVKFLVPGPSCQ